MKACFPTQDDRGLDAAVSDHFGSAPFFTLVSSEDGEVEVVVNDNAHHEHGTCHPLGRLAAFGVDAIVVKGIGRRALQHLHADGLKAYLPAGVLVADSLEALEAGRLVEIDAVHACDGHGHGGQHRSHH